MPEMKMGRMMVKDAAYYAAHVETLRRLNKQVESGSIGHSDLLKALNRSNFEVGLDEFITQDARMIKLKEDTMCITKFSANYNSVLITGPTGTGKELIARALGGCKPASFGVLTPEDAKRMPPFVARNCAGMPEELVYSLFFGHVKGTFTGADSDRHGILVQARDGVVFLDEIADLSLKAQALLLRALQERVVTRLGAVEEVPIHCRFVAATKFNLREFVALGKFREDLFARLFDFELRTTGLKERPDDIPLIAEKGLDRSGQQLEFTQPIPEHWLEDIYAYNVRGIQKMVQHWRTFGRL